MQCIEYYATTKTEISQKKGARLFCSKDEHQSKHPWAEALKILLPLMYAIFIYNNNKSFLNRKKNNINTF